MSAGAAPGPGPGADLVRALVLYALAEFDSGHARTIGVRFDGASFSVDDDGRGHAVDRLVASMPYPQRLYTQIGDPSPAGQALPILLQGIGLSLIARACSRLTVSARKPDATHEWVFAHGLPAGVSVTAGANAATGNTVSGEIDRRLPTATPDLPALAAWLAEVARARPGLTLRVDLGGPG